MKTSVSRAISVLNGYPLAAASVAAAAVLLLPLRHVLQLPAIMLLFVPVIIGLARLFGVGPSAVASVLAFLALDFLYVPPYYHLAVDSLPAWIALTVFVIVALVAGQQTGALRARERAAVQRQEELEFVNRLSRRIASARSPEDVAEFVVGQVTTALGARRAALYVTAEPPQAARSLASAGDPAPSSGEEALVGWVARTATAIGLPSVDDVSFRGPASVGADDALPGVTAEGVYLPLTTADSLEGVLYAGPPAEGRAELDPTLLVAVGNLVAASFERRRLEEEAARAEVLRETEAFKSTLVSSVSHELKTPLAAATARITGLLDEGAAADPDRVREELDAVSADLVRLNGSIGDLLDLSRLESDEWRPKREMHEVADILASAVSRLSAEQRARVRFSLATNAPFVVADFGQLARALVNLVENALAYSPAYEPVVVSTTARGNEILIAVEDRGPGVPDAEKERVFEKFYRGSGSANVPGGTGLGLAIAAEIVRSHGGRIVVEDAPPHGARFVVALPAGGWTERR